MMVITVLEFRMSAVSRQSEVHYTNFSPKVVICLVDSLQNSGPNTEHIP